MKEKRGIFTKILAVAGTVLVWIPLLAPVFFSVMFLIRTGMFRMDYLMPAELFLFALVGGVLLIWAALRARARWRLVGWGMGVAAAMFVLSGAIATLTGLASGSDPTWRLAMGARPDHARCFYSG